MRANGALVTFAFALLLVAGVLPLTARAQSPEPQGPAQGAQTAPATGAPGAVAVAPAPPITPSGEAAPAVAPPAQPPPAWLPRQSAELQIVEKVNATYRTLDVAVGKTTKIDALTISVKACVVRPPGQQSDAAAYLDITGKSAQSPSFQGWMLAAEPAVSLFKDPLYDVRVVGCH